MITLDKPAQLVELEDKLRNDKTGQHRQKLSNDLSTYKNQISHLIQRGDWIPTDFQALELLKKALEKASFVLTHSKF